MSISKKLVTVIFVVLLAFIAVNIYFLQFFTSRYFFTYLETIQRELIQAQKNQDTKEGIQEDVDDYEFEILDNLLSHPEITPEILEEIKRLNDDLRGITDSLGSYVENDPVINRKTLEDFLLARGLEPENVSNIIDTNSLSVFFQNAPFAFAFGDTESPERTFVLRVLYAMIGVNVIVMTITLMFVYIYVRRTFRPIRNITGNIEKIVDKGSYETIDYQKKDEFGILVNSINNLNKKLSYQEKIRSQFLTDISHELKTPMAAIRVYLEGIQDGVIKLDGKNTQSLIDEIQRLTRIVESMMFFQKFDENKLELEPKHIVLQDMVDWMSEYYGSELKNNQQTIGFEGTKNDEIFFDKDHFVQIMHNIISNFLKYAGFGKHLRINYISEGDSDVLIFQDNGDGIEEEKLPFLKEKFYQAEISKTGDIQSRGIGVGLSIIEKIVKASGGFMDIMSKRGEGFSVRLNIPRGPEEKS